LWKSETGGHMRRMLKDGASGRARGRVDVVVRCVLRCEVERRCCGKLSASSEPSPAATVDMR